MSHVLNSVATVDAASTSTYLSWLARNGKADGPINIFGKASSEAKFGDTLPTVKDAVSYLASGGDDYKVIWASVHSLQTSAIGKKRINHTDVVAYRYLAIDVDSRTAHDLQSCATDDERDKALEKASALDAMLQTYGLPQPLKAMTGNGSLLLYPIDLPNNEDNRSMMNSLGETLARLFDDEHCEIDKAVIKDPARVLGIVGTFNRKTETVDRQAKLRVVVGNYPPNDPMNEQEFKTAVSNLLVDHRQPMASVSFDYEPTTVETISHNPIPQHTLGAGSVEPIKIDGWDAVMVGNVGDKVARCKAYLSKCDDAIQGNGGSKATLRAACECYRFGLSHEQASSVMDWFNSSKCNPSWTDAEIRHKLNDAYKAVSNKGEIGCRLVGPDKPTIGTVSVPVGATVETVERVATAAPAPTVITAMTATTDKSTGDYPMTDVGNAEHFRDAYGDDVKYVVAWKAWLVWDGSRWARDNTDKVRRLALRHVRQTMPKYATTIKDDERRTKYLKWASMSQSESKIDSMISLASSYLACSPTDFDANPNLFNVSNGTIELDSQRFRPHNRGDLLMKISSAKYDATATAPTWDNFINRIFQDENGQPRLEVIEYVKRAVGYSMTADVSAQCFFVLHGKGKNGKTTFVDGVKNVMGEYAKNGMQSILMNLGDRSGTRNTDDEADLFGMRLVAVSETNEGMRFDAAKVKRLVDTSNIRAMRKFEHTFEFAATHKLWLCCNHMPKVDGNDDAMKRRLKKIPFMVQIPSHERDEHLGDKLKDEASGILNWMLQGLKSWFDDGRKLNEPREIMDAVGEYFQSNDTFGSFLSERIEPSDLAKVSVAHTYNAYCGWADENGLTYKLTKIEFGKRMRERGYDTKVSNSVRYFVGCSLASHDGGRVEADADAVDANDDRAF